MDLDALKILMVPDMGSSLQDVPHPMTLGRVEETPFSGWFPSADPRDQDEDPMTRRYTDVIFGRIVEHSYVDEYGEPVGKPEFLLQHKIDHPKRKSKDVAASALRARTMAGEKNVDGAFTSLPLRKRFPAAFDQFERRLREQGKPAPIALLDSVPPEVIESLLVLGVESVQEFAEADDTLLEKLAKRLEADKYVARARNVQTYREKAREYAGEAPRPRPGRKAA